jgi:hypothetical protein
MRVGHSFGDAGIGVDASRQGHGELEALPGAGFDLQLTAKLAQSLAHAL